MKNMTITLIAAAALLAGSSGLVAAEDGKKQRDDLMKDLYILNEGVRYLHDYYFEEIPSEKMVHDMLASYTDKLDPYTTLLEKQESQQMKMSLKGKYGGVGIVIGLRDENLIVVSPFEDTPAFRAGLKPQDRILQVDGKDT
ncbi:MAG: hypothetical protein PHQ23_12595, partial [Candidatus Wallbacteria bacterium]|nr:hypothetical protein [Candidatus Wallbacteria bacterium]